MAFLKKLIPSPNKPVFDAEKLAKTIELIPKDVWVYIFSYLSLRDLHSASKVSKMWYQMIMQPINENDPAVFDAIDTLVAQVWIDKIKQELTESPPEYSNKKTFQYKNFYTTMKKKSSVSSLVLTFLKKDFNTHFDEIEFNHFAKELEIYIQNDLDVLLKEFFEKGAKSHIWLFKYLNNATNINTLFNSSINCFKVILNFITQKQSNYTNIPFSAVNNSTLLHIATEKGREEFVRVLLTFCFSLTLKNKRSFTPLALAHKNGNTNILKLLCEKISFDDLKDLDRLSRDFREKFQDKYGIPYLLYLEMTDHTERLKDESSIMPHKIDYILQELTNNPDPKLITLFYDILQRKNPDLLEQLSELLDKPQSCPGLK